ncbi:MAG: DUF308 domain-containing protein [Eubacterium sp.]|nr:DUF308 domain-containing protein [Eubacterium sp.]
MTRERIHSIWLALFGAGLIAFGITILVQGRFLLVPAARIGGAVIMLSGLNQMIRAYVKKRRIPLISGLGFILMGLVTVFLPGMTLGILTMAFSLYLLLNAAVKLIDFIAAVRNKIPPDDIFADFFAFAAFLIFGVIMLFGSFYTRRMLLLISGIYCVLYGLTALADFVREILPNRAKTAVRRKIRVSLPLFISTFFPFGALKNYQKRLDSREIDIEKLLAEEKQLDKQYPPNIHVLIHVSGDGVGIMGHCDLYVDGEVLSYGNYDESSARLFNALGDGVMFVSEFEPYIEFSVRSDRQMVFDYGLRLTDEQLERVRAEIRRIKSSVYRWKPPYQRALERGEKAAVTDFKDYCSGLWGGTKAKFYKFRSGKFKSYCVMSTNCVLLADSILSKAGTDIIKVVGIISPGAYYDYLQKEYLLENGLVVSRDIYSKYNISGEEEENLINL